MIKMCISMTSHALDPPVTNCHTFSDPLHPPSSVTYFMDGPESEISKAQEINNIKGKRNRT